MARRTKGCNGRSARRPTVDQPRLDARRAAAHGGQALIRAWVPMLCALVVGALAGAAPFHIANRPPRPGEVDYRPADGATVPLNPPSFIWLHEPAAHTYAIQWSRTPDFAQADTITGFRWNTYTHHTPWPPGTYFWRYRFTTPAGQTSTWSVVRSVVVPPDATAFPMPTVAQQRERVPRRHPRLFLRPEDLPRLRQVARSGSAGSATGDGRDAGIREAPVSPGGSPPSLFARLRAQADKLIAAGPTPEPEHLGSARNKEDKEAVKYWWPNRLQTLQACEEAETLAFVSLLTGERPYAEAARRWILHLASWNPDGPTNFRLNCEAAKPLLHRLPRAYDWAYDALTDADREQVRAAVRRRVQDAWESWEVEQGVGHLTRPFGSHANRTWHKIGEAGIALLGELPEAEVWLDYAVNKFFACYPVWADDDGGWHEGVSYWAGYMSKAVWWLQVAQSALGIDGLKKPFFNQVGDFPLYVAPPGSPNAGFGDLSHNRPSPNWGGFLEYFVRAKGAQPDGQHAAYWRWWAEQWKMRSQDGILGFLYAANLPSLPPARPPSDLPASKVFRGIGVASLHTTLLDSGEDVHLLFKSSPFGTQSHGHNPHNSFQLNAYGEALLTTCVYRDLHGSQFHYEWAHSTRAHNAVLVDGQGQIKHTPAPHGRIVHFRLTPEVDDVMGEATDAYGGRLQRYQRHVALVKHAALGPLVVIRDDLQAHQPATFQFMLHALRPFDVDAAGARLRVEQPGAGVTVQYLSPEPLAFRQWDGYDPPPDRDFPNQWHVEAGTERPRTALSVFTVIVPYRAGRDVAWAAERGGGDEAATVHVRGAGQTVTVKFPSGRSGDSLKVSVE